MEHTVFSLKKDLIFSIPVDQETIIGRIDHFLSDLMIFLRKSGCRLIGHIKGMIESSEQGYIAFSVTSFEENINYKGKITGSIKVVKFLLNVIVYGVDERLIEKKVLSGLKFFHGGEENGTKEAEAL